MLVVVIVSVEARHVLILVVVLENKVLVLVVGRSVGVEWGLGVRVVRLV